MKRLMVRSSCGEALARLRISQPASRRGAARASSIKCGRGAIVGGVVRQLDPVDPAHQAAGLQQAGGAQAGFADQEARAEADIAGELVRLGDDHAADLEGGVADADAVAELEIEPRQQRRIDRRAERAVALGQQIGHRHLRLERQLAEHRIVRVDRLQFDQRELAVAGAGHGRAGSAATETWPRARRKATFLGLGFALDQREGDVAAEQRAALARQGRR